MSSPLDTILSKLDGVKGAGERKFVAKCPAHEDRRQSLSVSEGDDGRVLLNCFAGCETEAIVAALALDMAALFPPKESSGKAIVATYDYTDEEGSLLFQVVRFAPKDFRQRRPDGQGGWTWKLGGTRRVLYRLPAVLAAAKRGEVVFLCEGEKDADAVGRKLGLVATTAPGGAGKGKWKADYTAALTGARVVILPDNDEPGREYADAVREALSAVTPAVLLELPDLPDKGDVSDWIAAGGTRETLADLATAALSADAPQPKSIIAAEAIYECLLDMERRRKGEVKGLSLPPEWSSLHRTIGDLEPGSFTIVAARPSIGKTMWSLQLQRHLCDRGESVLYVSRELTPTRLMRRHLAHCGVDMRNMRTGRLDDQETRLAMDLSSRASRWPCWYDYHSRTVDEIRREAELTGARCVIVDYLQRLAYDTESEYAAITRLVNELQDLALDLGVVVVCMSQLSRPIKGKEHKPPHMSETRGSGAVEERATNLILLHRLFTTEKDDHGNEIAASRTEDGFFIVAKCADGEADRTISALYDGRHMRIVEKGTA